VLPTPALCRLCRRPIPRTVSKCPYCRARRALVAEGAPQRRTVRIGVGWRPSLYAGAVVVAVVVVVLWFTVLRDIRAPVSAGDTAAKPAGRHAAECVALITELGRTPTDRSIDAETRDRLRRCLDRR
jgi:hypothetical protein